MTRWMSGRPWQTSLLEAGHDSPSLRMLAGADREESERRWELLRRSLAELGLSVPAPVDADLSRARRIARAMLRGEMQLDEGARGLRRIHETFPDAASLRSFVDYFDEYGGDPKAREWYTDAILDCCRTLLDEP